MSNNFMGNMASLYANTARARAAGFNKSFAGMQGKNAPVKWFDVRSMIPAETETFEQPETSVAVPEHTKRKPLQEKQVCQENSVQKEAIREVKKEQTAKASDKKSSQQRSRGSREEGRNAFSQKELQKAIAMSVVLAPPVSRKRKRYEGITDRR